MSESNGYLSPFIGDGYDLEATIPANPGRWSEVRIRYRPLSIDEVEQIYALVRFSPQEPVSRFFAATYAGTKDKPGNLRSWTLKDSEGKPVPITADNLGKLRKDFYELLSEVIQIGSSEADVKN